MNPCGCAEQTDSLIYKWHQVNMGQHELVHGIEIIKCKEKRNLGSRVKRETIMESKDESRVVSRTTAESLEDGLSYGFDN